jgi:hypothetical protein
MEDSDLFYGLYKTIDKEPSKYHLYMGIFLMGESWETEFHSSINDYGYGSFCYGSWLI